MARVRCPCPCRLCRLAQNRGAVLGARHLSCKFSNKMAFKMSMCILTAQASAKGKAKFGSFLEIFPFRVRRGIQDTWGLGHPFCMTGAGHRTPFQVQSRSVKLSSFLISDMMMIPCCRCGTSDASRRFFVAGAVCRPRQKSGWDLGKTSFLTFSMLIFPWWAQCLAKI